MRILYFIIFIFLIFSFYAIVKVFARQIFLLFLFFGHFFLFLWLRQHSLYFLMVPLAIHALFFNIALYLLGIWGCLYIFLIYIFFKVSKLFNLIKNNRDVVFYKIKQLFDFFYRKSQIIWPLINWLKNKVNTWLVNVAVNKPSISLANKPNPDEKVVLILLVPVILVLIKAVLVMLFDFWQDTPTPGCLGDLIFFLDKFLCEWSDYWPTYKRLFISLGNDFLFFKNSLYTLIHYLGLVKSKLIGTFVLDSTNFFGSYQVPLVILFRDSGIFFFEQVSQSFPETEGDCDALKKTFNAACEAQLMLAETKILSPSQFWLILDTIVSNVCDQLHKDRFYGGNTARQLALLQEFYAHYCSELKLAPEYIGALSKDEFLYVKKGSLNINDPTFYKILTNQVGQLSAEEQKAILGKSLLNFPLPNWL